MSAAPKANPPIRTLLGPGPSPVNPRVLQALSLPVVGHLDPKFLELMDQSMAMLREHIRFLSSCLTLRPGDLITTGTPAGVSKLRDGDHLHGTIEKIGSMELFVKDDE